MVRLAQLLVKTKHYFTIQREEKPAAGHVGNIHGYEVDVC